MAIRTFSRATEPHFRSLATALQPLLQRWRQWYDQGQVFIEHEDFAGTTNAAIQTVIDAAPTASPALDLKADVDTLPPLIEAIVWTLADAINIERQQHSRPAITKAGFRTAVKAKIDEGP